MTFTAETAVPGGGPPPANNARSSESRSAKEKPISSAAWRSNFGRRSRSSAPKKANARTAPTVRRTIRVGFTVPPSRWLSAGLQHVHHAEAFLHERAQSFGADQAAVAVHQSLAGALDSGAEIGRASCRERVSRW